MVYVTVRGVPRILNWLEWEGSHFVPTLTDDE